MRTREIEMCACVSERERDAVRQTTTIQQQQRGPMTPCQGVDNRRDGPLARGDARWMRQQAKNEALRFESTGETEGDRRRPHAPSSALSNSVLPHSTTFYPFISPLSCPLIRQTLPVCRIPRKGCAGAVLAPSSKKNQ